MENTKIFEMADRLKTLQEQKKDLEAKAKALGAEITDLDLQLSDAMTEAELDRFSRNGSTFYLKSRLFASPVAGRKDEMMQALKENGYGSLVTETVNANTLASFIKEQRVLRNSVKLPARKFQDGSAIPSALMKKCQSGFASRKCVNSTEALQKNKITTFYRRT